MQVPCEELLKQISFTSLTVLGTNQVLRDFCSAVKLLMSIILYLDFNSFWQTFTWQVGAFTESHSICEFITESNGFSEFTKENNGAQDTESIH